MNKEKIISYLMMQTLEATRKALECLNEWDLDKLELLRTQIKNIEYYARMIIEKDGVL